MSDFVEENLHMQRNVKEHRNPLLHKIITVVFLPITIFVWMIGWTLNQIGSETEHTEIRQKTLQTHPKFKEYNKEIEAPHEGSKIADKPQIIA